MNNRQLLGSLAAACRRHRKILVVLGLLAFALPDMAVYFHEPGRGGDIHFYIQAGNDALALRDLYGESGPALNNTWPPFCSFAMVPLALSARAIGLPLTKELWHLLNLAALVAAACIWMRMLTGRPTRLLARTGPDFSSPEVFLPLLFVLPALVKNFFDLQINPIVLLLIVVGLREARRERAWAAGAALAAATSLKVIPGIFLIYFLARRQWRVALWMAGCGLALNVSPALLYGADGFAALVRDWLSLSLVDELVATNDRFSNQSLYAAAEYYLSNRLQLVDAGAPVLRTVAWIASGGLLLVTLFRTTRKRYAPAADRTCLEYAAVCLVMILVSPIAWPHYWVYAYPASAAVFYHLKRRPELWRSIDVRFSMIAWIALLLLPYLMGGAIHRGARSFASMTVAALVLNLLALTLWARSRSSIGESAGPAGDRTPPRPRAFDPP